jgi:hypothetical protein
MFEVHCDSTCGPPVVELITGLRDRGPEETLWVTALDDHTNAKANDLISGQLKQWVLANISRLNGN